MNNSITGTQLVQGIHALLSDQSLSSQNKRQIATTIAISKFAQEHQIAPQTGAISLIAKALKLGDHQALSAIREISPALGFLTDTEALHQIAELRKDLNELQSNAHQAKTRSTFIAAFLRPFANRYTNRWFIERSDIDVSEAKMMIEYLERKKISSVADLMDWADDVVELFIGIVVYIDRDPDARFTRPIGTVSEKSSRTYLQSWKAFIDSESANILRYAIDIKEGVTPKTGEVDFSLDRNGVINQRVSKPSLSSINKLKEHSETSNFSKAKLGRQSLAVPELSITVSIASNLEPNAIAKRKWSDREDFANTVDDWIATFPLLWEESSQDFQATIEIRSETGEASVGLPKLTPESASEKIIKAVELQL